MCIYTFIFELFVIRRGSHRIDYISVKKNCNTEHESQNSDFKVRISEF